MRGRPGLVVSDHGSQLTSEENYINWQEVGAHETLKLTCWELMPGRCQYCNDLCKRQVAIVKKTIGRMIKTTILGGSPIFSYDELQVVLSEAVNMIND